MKERPKILAAYIAWLLGSTALVGSTVGEIGDHPFPPAVALVSIPILAFAFSRKGLLPEPAVLVLAVIPITFLNYLYAIRVGYPTGFEDVHAHVVQTSLLFSEWGTIDFSVAQTTSFNFVGLYVSSRFSGLSAGLGITDVALVAPNLLVSKGPLVGEGTENRARLQLVCPWAWI